VGKASDELIVQAVFGNAAAQTPTSDGPSHAVGVDEPEAAKLVVSDDADVMRVLLSRKHEQRDIANLQLLRSDSSDCHWFAQ
jgi:hypothetical protein